MNLKILLLALILNSCAAIATDPKTGRIAVITILSNDDRITVSGTGAEIIKHNISVPLGTIGSAAAMFRATPMLRP